MCSGEKQPWAESPEEADLGVDSNSEVNESRTASQKNNSQENKNENH